MEWINITYDLAFVPDSQMCSRLIPILWYDSSPFMNNPVDCASFEESGPDGIHGSMRWPWIALIVAQICLHLVAPLLQRLLAPPKQSLLLERERSALMNQCRHLDLELELECPECLHAYMEIIINRWLVEKKKQRHVYVQPVQRRQMKRLEHLCRLAIPRNDSYFSVIASSAKRVIGKKLDLHRKHSPRFLSLLIPSTSKNNVTVERERSALSTLLVELDIIINQWSDLDSQERERRLGRVYELVSSLPHRRYSDLSSRFCACDVVSNNLLGIALFKIVVQGVKAGIKYLHRARKQSSIIHSDMKPTNILLDEHIVPKMTHFDFLSLRDHCDRFSGLSTLDFPRHTANSRFSVVSVPHPLIREMAPLATRRKVISALLKSMLPKVNMTKRLGSAAWPNVCEAGLVSANPKPGSPNAGKDSEFNIRKGSARRTENEPPHHPRQPFIIQPGCGIKAVNTSATWALATAAPHHATGNRGLLSGFVTEHDDLFVHAVDMVPMPVRAQGAVLTDAMVLPDVWFVPGLTTNLVSVSQLAKLGYSIGFGCGECRVSCAGDGRIVGKARLREGGLYVLDFLKVSLAM